MKEVRKKMKGMAMETLVIKSHIQLNLVESQRDLAAVEEKVESTSTQAAQLVEEYTDAYQHISDENDSMVSAWNMLLERAALRKDRLMQAEQLQLYFNEFRELR